MGTEEDEGEAGWTGRKKPAFDEVLHDAEEMQQKHHSSQSASCYPPEHILFLLS